MPQDESRLRDVRTWTKAELALLRSRDFRVTKAQKAAGITPQMLQATPNVPMLRTDRTVFLHRSDGPAESAYLKRAYEVPREYKDRMDANTDRINADLSERQRILRERRAGETP